MESGVISQGDVARDIVELLVRRAKRFGRWPAIRYRPKGGVHEELSWADWLEHAQAIANGLRSMGVEAGHHVAIFAANCPEWLVADIGILMTGAVCLPISRTAPAAARARMLLELGPRIIFVGTHEDLERLRKNRAGLDASTQIVMFHPPADEEMAAAGRRISERRPLQYSDLLVRGRAILERGDGIRPKNSGRDPDAPATIIYSAGRSGPARGAVLSHGGLVRKLYALREVVILPRSATQLLLLPLGGIFGRLMAWAAIDQGATTYIHHRERPLLESLSDANPHFVAGAPATFERLRDIILTQREGAMGGPGRATLYLAGRFMGGGRKRHLRLFQGLNKRLARRLLRTRVRHLLGGRLQHLVCGGGVLDDSLAELFEFAGIPVLEGYGSSETFGVATANRPESYRRGSVGQPLRGVSLKLSPRGEVLLSGDGIFSGYLQPRRRDTSAPGATSLQIDPSVDEQGWYHTGDLGLIEEDFLFLTGRSEDIIKLSTGRTVAPAYIEGALAAAGGVKFVVVCGDNRPYVSALIWAQGADDSTDREQAPTAPSGEDGHVLKRLVDQVNLQLERHEQVKAFHVMAGQLSVERGELSASGEPIRSVIYRRCEDEIESLYNRGE